MKKSQVKSVLKKAGITDKDMAGLMSGKPGKVKSSPEFIQLAIRGTMYTDPQVTDSRTYEPYEAFVVLHDVPVSLLKEGTHYFSDFSGRSPNPKPPVARELYLWACNVMPRIGSIGDGAHEENGILIADNWDLCSFCLGQVTLSPAPPP